MRRILHYGQLKSYMAYDTEFEKIAKTRNLEHWVCF